MQKGVSEMLHRLYSPFLWRSLKVANPEVRANACTLLLDAFPLQDPDSTREEIDGVMQKQFDGMIVSFIISYSFINVEYSSTVTDMIENYGNVAKFCRKLHVPIQ